MKNNIVKDSWTEQFLFSQFADAAAYLALIGKLRDQFARRFAELRARSQDFALFANPFEAIVKNVPVHLQMKLVDLQCGGDLKSKFAEVPLVKFYGEYIPHDKCPVLVK